MVLYNIFFTKLPKFCHLMQRVGLTFVNIRKDIKMNLEHTISKVVPPQINIVQLVLYLKSAKYVAKTCKTFKLFEGG